MMKRLIDSLSEFKQIAQDCLDFCDSKGFEDEKTFRVT